MKRSTWTITIAAALAVMIAIPALAAGPNVSKRVLGEADGTAVVLISVTATDQTIYAVTIKDASASIKDIIAPKGWVGITSGSDVLFRTGSKPIKAGTSTSFRIYTTNSGASLTLSFKDDLTTVGESKTL
jgi:hypothetical protein